MTNKNGRITKIESRLEQLQNQKKKLLQAQKKAERAARTKRLIERSAEMTNDEIAEILKRALGNS